MNILNEQIEHILFGEGKVIGQKEEKLVIQFSEEVGVKQFLYPDAFEKHLKLNNPGIELSVLGELHDKQAQSEAEKLRKKQEYEAYVESMALERSKRTTQKRKTSSKSKAAKFESENNLTVLEKLEEELE